LTATEIARLPNKRMQARESLPLLPSVIRGPDGLMRLSGARPSESPMMLDGFDVTDPATGVTSISLAYEAVQGVEVLRDPMTTTYGGLMGALFKMETRAGDQKQIGLQGFIPRPRFQNPGFGRIEGSFPRFFMGGRSGGARFRYFTAVEYNFERITVPADWDFGVGRRVNSVTLDNCFDGWDGHAAIVWPQRHLRLDLEATVPLRHLVIYVPPGQSFFCVEPVSHANGQVGLAPLGPGGTLAGEVVLRISNL